MSGLTPHKVNRMNKEIRAQVVDRVHAAMLVTQGTCDAPTKERIAEGLDFILDEALDHPDYQDKDFFWGTGGFVVYVERGANRWWHTYRVLVPSTASMCHYLPQTDEEPK